MKALKHKKIPDTWGTIVENTLCFGDLPQLFPDTCTKLKLKRAAKLVNESALDDYDLVTVTVTDKKPEIITGIERIGGAHGAWFRIGQQTFSLYECDSRKEATWFEKMMKEAFNSIGVTVVHSTGSTFTVVKKKK